MTLVDISIYAIFFGLLLFALKSERLDLYCPSPPRERFEWEEKIEESPVMCKDGMSKFHAHPGREDDDVATLLEKTEKVVVVNSNVVKWRRCFIITTLIMIMVWALIIQKMPSGPEFIFMFLVVFMPIYFSYMYYTQHFDRFSNEQVIENVSC